MARLSTPSVNTTEAVDQDRQGTRTRGFGQLVAARDAICKFNETHFPFQQATQVWESYVTTHRNSCGSKRAKAVSFTPMEEYQWFQY